MKEKEKRVWVPLSTIGQFFWDNIFLQMAQLLWDRGSSWFCFFAKKMHLVI